MALQQLDGINVIDKLGKICFWLYLQLTDLEALKEFAPG